MSKDALALSADTLALSKDALALSADTLALSKDALALSKDALALEGIAKFNLLQIQSNALLSSSVGDSSNQPLVKNCNPKSKI